MVKAGENINTEGQELRMPISGIKQIKRLKERGTQNSNYDKRGQTPSRGRRKHKRIINI